MNEKHTGEIGGWRFVMIDDSTIEVWSNNSEEDLPDTYIYVRSGSIRDVKDFHMEISDFYIKNLS
jgi:hypothetical protein